MWFSYLFITSLLWLMHFGSVVTVNRTDTETAVFCYPRASSSPLCFRPKTAQCLCIFIFFIAYTTSAIFTFLHDDHIRSFAINLYLTFYLGFAHHHRCPQLRTALIMTANNDRVRDCLTAPAPYPRSAAADGQCGNRSSQFSRVKQRVII